MINIKLCNKSGCGICIGCNRVPDKGQGDICRYIAEELLDKYQNIIEDLVDDLYIGKPGSYDNREAKNEIMDGIKSTYSLSDKYLPKW